MKNTIIAAILISAFSFALSCTKEPSGSGNTLSIEITSIKDTTFTISVSSPESAGWYAVGVVTKDDFDRIGDASETAGLLENIEDLPLYYGANDIDAGSSWNIRPKKEYTVLAFYVDEDRRMVSEPVFSHTTTLGAQMSDNVISLTVVSEEGIISVETSNDDGYFLDCIKAGDIEGYPLESLAEFIIGSYGPAIEYCIEHSDVERDFSTILEEDTEYYAIAFGYLYGYATTDIVMEGFTTPAGEVHKDCTFTSVVSDITMTSARVTVTPSDDNVSYMTNVHSKSVIDSYLDGEGLEQFVKDQLEIIAEALSDQYGMEITPEQAAGMISIKGEDTFTYTTLNADSEYYVFATGIDNKGRITTDIYISPETFRTKAPSTGPDTPMECTITVNGMTAEGVSISVVPEDKQMTYVGMAGEADYYREFGSDAEYLADDIALWTEMAAAEQMSLVELLDSYGLFLSGDATYIFPEIFEPGIEYIAYTYGLSPEGEVTAGINVQFFMVNEDGTVSHTTCMRMGRIKEQICTTSPNWITRL